jgi:hypothetical protein
MNTLLKFFLFLLLLLGIDTSIHAGWSNPTFITNSASSLNFVQIRINQNNYAVVIYASTTNNNLHSATLVPGSTWSLLTVTSSTVISPQVAIDGTGNAVAIWSTGSSIVASSLAYQASSWSATPTQLDAGGQTTATPAIAMNASGQTVAVWVRNDPTTGNPSIQAATSTFGGSWSTPQTLSNTAFSSSTPVVGIDSSGNTFAVWNENGVIQTSKASFGGSWSTETALSTGTSSSAPQLAVNSGGQAVAVWVNGATSTIQASRYSSGSWEASAHDISASDTVINPQVAIDPSGNSTAIWSEGTNIMSAFATISGSWQTPLTAYSTGLTPDSSLQLHITVDNYGDFVLVYSQTNPSVSPPSGITTGSTLGGSWYPYNRLLTGSSSTNLTSSIASGPSGYAIAIWNPSARNITSSTFTTIPLITNVSPNYGSIAGGTSVTITGGNFSTSTTSAVTFGSTPAASFTVNSDTQITATSPAASAGTVDITVTNAVGTSNTSSADQFFYETTPTVTNVNPNAGPTSGGTSVVITGTDFLGTTAVSFGSTPATGFTVNSITQITATAPAESAGTVHVTVTTPQGTSSTSSSDEYTYTAPPTVTGVSPNDGPTSGGTSVTITGTSFTTASAVTFGSTPATSFTVNSDTQITATSPAESAGTVHITVTNPGGTSATSPSDQFTYVSQPTVTGVSPNGGPIAGGTSVTITGTSFTTASAVTFGSTPATSFTVNSDTQITATSPAESAGTVHITVTNPGGTSTTSSSDQYTYYSRPTVTNVNPNSGSTMGGNPVIITGTSFTGATAVTFGLTPATSFTVNSPTQITATAPAESVGAVHVTVTNPGGTSTASSSDIYTYALSPAITNVSPNYGSISGGNSVVITGGNFTGATDVSFGINSASFLVDSDTQITATAPAGAVGTVNITVTTPEGTSAIVPADEYIYNTTPTITGLSQTSGPPAGGNTVILTGTCFLGTTQVAFGANPASFTVDSNTQITATAPPEAVALTKNTVDVTVTTPEGTSPGVLYTYFSTSVNPPRKFHGKLFRRHLHHDKNFWLKAKWKPPKDPTGITTYIIYEDGKAKYTLNAKHHKFHKKVRASHHLHKRYKIAAATDTGATSEKKKLKIVKKYR